jgi:hypothetical protein
VPTLLEIQRVVGRSLLAQNGEADPYVVPDKLTPGARLSVYRNTMLGALTTVLRLSYPAVHRLVGVEFFNGAARIFIEKEPPLSAFLDEYGAGFAEFLAHFPPAASVFYLPGVARLDWAVSRALHAPDVSVLNLSCLAELDPAEHARIAFVPHPSVDLVQADCPVDAIWRAVLARHDAAITAIDLESGPVWLLVQRYVTGVEVARMSEREWRFAKLLCAGRPLQAALDEVPDLDAAAELAGHFLAGRFTGFRLNAAL